MSRCRTRGPFNRCMRRLRTSCNTYSQRRLGDDLNDSRTAGPKMRSSGTRTRCERGLQNSQHRLRKPHCEFRIRSAARWQISRNQHRLVWHHRCQGHGRNVFDFLPQGRFPCERLHCVCCPVLRSLPLAVVLRMIPMGHRRTAREAAPAAQE